MIYDLEGNTLDAVPAIGEYVEEVDGVWKYTKIYFSLIITGDMTSYKTFIQDGVFGYLITTIVDLDENPF